MIWFSYTLFFYLSYSVHDLVSGWTYVKLFHSIIIIADRERYMYR